MKGYRVTPSGTFVSLTIAPEEDAPKKDATCFPFDASSGGTAIHGRVFVDAAPMIDINARQNYGVTLNAQLKERLAAVAILDRIDKSPSAFEDPASPLDVMIDADNLGEYLDRPTLTDREIRQYIARRMYVECSLADLDKLLRFDELDHLLTGASNQDFLRNAQVLEGDGYLRLSRTMGGNFDCRATGDLIRDVERYGSAKDDAMPSQDYPAKIKGYPALAERQAAILAEYGRFSTATEQIEVASVFRALAPIVEAVLREALRRNGVKRDPPNLGSMISELQSRRLGGRHLYSQLNHVLKFTRDLEQHGADQPESVLRIATENAFALLPQIAAL